MVFGWCIFRLSVGKDFWYHRKKEPRGIDKMLSIQGIYENGKIRLLEHMPKEGRFDIIVTFLDERKKVLIEKDNLEGLFSDLNENDFNEILGCYHNRGQDWFKGRKAEV